MCTTATTQTSLGRTTALFRNFDVNSSQFALNMLELVADKAPDATASRVGYHVALGFGQAMNLVNGCDSMPGQFVQPNQTSINISRKDIWNISRR